LSCTFYTVGNLTHEEYVANPTNSSRLVVSESTRWVAPSPGYSGLLPLRGTVSTQWEDEYDSWGESGPSEGGPEIHTRDNKIEMVDGSTGQRESGPKLKVGERHTPFPIADLTYSEWSEGCRGAVGEQTLHRRAESYGSFTVTRIASPRPPE
jgi:hypothetical protein